MGKNKVKSSLIKEIDNEITSVYEYCLAAGLTHEEIVAKAKPLLQPLVREEWKNAIVLLFKLAVCCSALFYTLSSEIVIRSAMEKGRMIIFKVLPYWDWTTLHTEDCMVSNPYYSSYGKDQSVDCQTCEEVYEIEKVNSTSTEEISGNYMERNIPVIVTDAMTDWLVMQDSFNVLNLTEGFNQLNEDVCMLQTNLGVDNHYKVFKKLLNKKLNKWYAHWENCEKANQKLIRKFYTQPYFLPAIVQMTGSNWILMSSGFHGKTFKKIFVSPEYTVMWVAQVRGYNVIQFTPKEPCHETCNMLHDTVEEGEIVLYNPKLWDLSYLPGEQTENLAFAAGGLSHFRSVD